MLGPILLRIYQTVPTFFCNFDRNALIQILKGTCIFWGVGVAKDCEMVSKRKKDKKDKPSGSEVKN